MEFVLYALQWLHILSILSALIFLLLTTKRYSGVIGQALTYLSIGIIFSALVAIYSLLRSLIDFTNFGFLRNVLWEDIVYGGFVSFSFIMIAVGFYKLSSVYKRM